MRPSWTQVLIGVGTTLGVVLVSRKAYSIYRTRKLASSDNLPAPECKFIQASIHGGKRDMSRVKWIVIHVTDGGSSAENIGNYFAAEPREVLQPDGTYRTEPGGSTNLVVGEDGCVQSVPDDVIPAGAPPLNETGLHIEFVGQSKWSRAQWLERLQTLEHGRRKIRDWSRKYGIPRALRGSGELLAGLPGATTHASITQAWHKTSHLDPGPGFPLDLVLGDQALVL